MVLRPNTGRGQIPGGADQARSGTKPMENENGRKQRIWRIGRFRFPFFPEFWAASQPLQTATPP